MTTNDAPASSRTDRAPVAVKHKTVVVAVAMEADVGHARRVAAAMADQMGFGSAATHRLATAVSELGNNLVTHAIGGGRISLTELDRDGRLGIEINAADDGPGIADIDAAMTDGFSSNNGLGGGLPGCRRLMDEFAIESVSGRGTRVTAWLWLPQSKRTAGAATEAHRVPTAIGTASMNFGSARRSANAGEMCGDMAGRWSRDGLDFVVIADGLGHGKDAATAAAAALAAAQAWVGRDLAELFQCMNVALRPTRGAAVGVAMIDRAARQITYAAVGNTRAALFGARSTHLEAYPGIVGGGYRRLTAVVVPFQSGEVLALWSDGVDERLELGKADHSAASMDSMAEGLLDRFAKGYDDRCVIVMRLTTA